MSKVFKELAIKAENISELIEKKDDQGIQGACAEIKALFLDNLEDIKKSIIAIVKSRSRRKALGMKNEVKDARIQVELSIRSAYLTSASSESDARANLIVVAKKLIKIERALSFAEDMLFAGEIKRDLGDVITHADSVIEESKAAVVAARNTARLQQANKNDHGMQYRK